MIGTDDFDKERRKTAEERFDEYALMRWADDGGCCPVEFPPDDEDDVDLVPRYSDHRRCRGYPKRIPV